MRSMKTIKRYRNLNMFLSTLFYENGRKKCEKTFNDSKFIDKLVKSKCAIGEKEY